MRTIPSAVQTLLENDFGQEVVVILEVFWANGIGSQFYADRALDGTPVQGKILSMSGLDEAIQISAGSNSQSLQVTLDDTKGDIKAIFDVNDVHKVPVKVWFYMIGTDFDTEKFEVFTGQINSPVVWSEGLRQFTLSVLNKIEDKEVGFSAEEGQFPALPEDLIGKPWPLCFGTTVNVPALRAVPAVSGKLLRGVGIKDFTLPRRLNLANEIICPQTAIGFRCSTSFVGGGTYKATCNVAYETDQACLQARCVEIERLTLMLQEQTSYEYARITILGGKNFPQGRTITLNINGGLFTGKFNGTAANPTNVFDIMTRRHPRDDGTGNVIVDDQQAEILSKCPSAATDAQDSDWGETAFGPYWTGQRTSRLSWEAYRNALSADFFWAGGGSTVTMQNASEIIYIANIVPSTIIRVAAWRTINGNRFLLTVPSSFYTIRQTDYNGYNVMEVVFQRPLSAEQQETGGGWSDDIYITQISSVGPNPIDVISWFIDTYTDYSKDTTSFSQATTDLDTYSFHFPLLVRKNLLTVLNELATQSRCAIYLKGNTFFIKYLSKSPTPVATITEDDILEDDSGNGTLQIELTKTEDLVTKLTAEWQNDYSLNEKNTLILRHRLVDYGTHERIVDYYAFYHLDWVRKTATYWLIRWANTWKKLRFSTSLEFMKLEAFDAVTFTLADVATSSFIGIVERAEFDSDRQQINFEVWTPVRAGTMVPYNFAWPANIAQTALFPTIEAINRKQAGSGTEPNFSVIAPPGHPLETSTKGIYQGIQLGCNGAGVLSLKPGECRQDFGDRNPSDTGDVKQGVDTTGDDTGNISGGTSPITNGNGYGWWTRYQDQINQSNKIEQDAGRGREEAARAGNSSDVDAETEKAGDDFRDFVENLPDPDDLDPDKYPCQVRATITGFKTRESGTKPICVPASPAFTEIVVFNSRSAALAFCNSINTRSNCGYEPPCDICSSCEVTTTVGETDCEPDDGNKSMIGYRKTGLSDGDDRSMFMP